jgi:Ni/Fe-hydrogenase subunit HybB-like protein
MASGLALVLFILATSKKLGVLKVEGGLLSDIGKLLSVIVLVDMFLLVSEYVTTVWPNVPEETSSLMVVFFGPYGYLAWTQWSLALLAVGLLIYPKTRRSLYGLITAAVFIMFEVFIYRLDLVIPAYVDPLVQLPPGTSVGTYLAGSSSFMIAGVYLPSLVEWGIVAGILSLSLLILALALHFLPFGTDESSEQIVASARESTTPVQ